MVWKACLLTFGFNKIFMKIYFLGIIKVVLNGTFNDVYIVEFDGLNHITHTTLGIIIVVLNGTLNDTFMICENCTFYYFH
jgi:hypothetical protein